MGQNASGIAGVPYTAGAEVCRVGPGVSLLEGHETSGAKGAVSIFAFAHDSPTAANLVTRLKKLRHPSVLGVKGVYEIPPLPPDHPRARSFVVTDPVQPLALLLQNKSIQPTKDQDHTVAWGLYQIAKAVAFVNKSGLVHGNLSPWAVYVTETGDWRLGGFDFASDLDDLKLARPCPLIDFLCNPSKGISSNSLQLPPEICQAQGVRQPWPAGAVNFADLPPSAIDAWGLAVLIYHIFNYNSVKVPFEKASLKDVSGVPGGLREMYSKLLAANPRSRPSLDELLKAPYFAANDFVEACLFLEEIAIKDAFEKEKFFRKLPKVLPHFPDFYAQRKILPHLVSALDFGGVNSLVLAPLLRIAGQLSEADFRRQVQPAVVKWFASPDRALRLALLQNLPPLIAHLDQTTASRDIFPSVAQGFLDPSPQLRELTVIAIVQFAPLLSPALVNGDLLKYLAKLQVDPQPGVRYNTTVALGKIARFLTPQTREKVLIAAFTRALRDDYSPARRAGLASLLITHTGLDSAPSPEDVSKPKTEFQSYYTAVDVGVKLLPSVAPMSFDPDPTVRRLAIEAIQAFLDTLRSHQATLDQQFAAQQAQQQRSGAPKTPGEGQAEGGTVLGWASKWIYGPTSGPQSPVPNSPPTPTTNPTSLPKASSSTILVGPTPLRPSQRGESEHTTPKASGWEDSTDGWGETPAQQPSHSVDPSKASLYANNTTWQDDSDFGSGWPAEKAINNPSTATARPALSPSISSTALQPTKSTGMKLGSSSPAQPPVASWEEPEDSDWGEDSSWDFDTPAATPSRLDARSQQKQQSRQGPQPNR